MFDVGTYCTNIDLGNNMNTPRFGCLAYPTLLLLIAFVGCDTRGPAAPPDPVGVDTTSSPGRNDTSLAELGRAHAAMIRSRVPIGPGAHSTIPHFSTASFEIMKLRCPVMWEQFRYDSITRRGWDTMTIAPDEFYYTIMYMNRDLSGSRVRDAGSGDTIRLSYVVPWYHGGDSQRIVVEAVVDTGAMTFRNITMHFDKREDMRASGFGPNDTMQVNFVAHDVPITIAPDGTIACQLTAALLTDAGAGFNAYNAVRSDYTGTRMFDVTSLRYGTPRRIDGAAGDIIIKFTP